MVAKPPPLDWQTPIVDPAGKPTPSFQRLWQAQLVLNNNLPDLGNAAAVSAALDLIGSVRGAMLVRGASGWQLLTPGISGRLLTTNGMGADPSWATLSSLLDGISATQGSVLYRSNVGWSALAPGASGNVLTTQGAGANPKWAPAAGGGVPVGTPPTVVQVGYLDANNNVGTVTMGAAPTNGNLLVCAGNWPGAGGAGTGWTQVYAYTNSGTQYSYVMTKTAGVGELATQTPRVGFGAAGRIGIVIWELSGWHTNPILFVSGAYAAPATAQTTVNAPGMTDVLALGIVAGDGALAPFTGCLNMTQDVLSTAAAGDGICAGHATAAFPVSQLFATMSTATATRQALILVK